MRMMPIYCPCHKEKYCRPSKASVFTLPYKLINNYKFQKMVGNNLFSSAERSLQLFEGL